MTTSTRADLLRRLETYYDAVPRAQCGVEEHGPLTLFVARRGWDYYARPRLGLRDAVTASEVRAVLARQRELGVPESLEWVHETTPSLRAAAQDAGLAVEECPLLVLDGSPVVRKSAAEVRRIGPDDEDLGTVRAAIAVGFGQPHTAVDTYLGHSADALRRGLSVLFGAFDPGVGAVGGGSHNPRDLDGGGVSEVVGVGVLPAYRRRGIAAHLSGALARHALDTGTVTVFCSAAGDAVARIYESVGFRRVGTACVAEPATQGR